MDISKELMIVITFGVELYTERGYAPLRIASNSKTWAQRAQELALFGTISLTLSYLLSRIFFQTVILKFESFKYILETFKEFFPYQHSGTIVCMGFSIVIFVYLFNFKFRNPVPLYIPLS